ncbi:MAG: hypothetical protein COX55_03085 [Zetaproteobacteria bacterium CG23_combo_of_CG06-09_8_20_14_all_54_7]|nr:MAG: hypothetical protein COX55_03085 [Zetaproteobacteria bacterium CG23_combo_of_CG06-09_8_20_14_all_54_7]
MPTPPTIHPLKAAASIQIGGEPFTAVLTGICGTSSKRQFLPGAAVPEILRVRLSTKAGKLWQGITIRFEVASGGGTLSNGDQITDRLGAAALPRNAWVLGPAVGTQTVTATALVAGVEANPHLFRRVVAGELTGSIIRIVSGNGQSGPANSTLPLPLIVAVFAADGITPVAGANVTWQIIGGNTIIIPSDNQGQSGVSLQTGGTPSANSVVIARLDNGSSVSFIYSVTA